MRVDQKRTIINNNGKMMGSGNGVMPHYPDEWHQSWNGNVNFPEPPANSVLYLPGNPGTGTAIKDYSGNGNDGAITGAIWRRLPSGLWYISNDGIDDHTDNASPTGLDITSGGLHVSIWVRRTLDTNRDEVSDGILSYGGLDTGGYSIFIQTDNKFSFRTWNVSASNLAADSAATANTWYHVAGDHDGTTQRLYINGVEQAATSEVAMPATITTSLEIGRWAELNTRDFGGHWCLPRILNASNTSLASQCFQNERYLFGV